MWTSNQITCADKISFHLYVDPTLSDTFFWFRQTCKMSGFAAQLLNELMGADRNKDPSEKKREIRWDDPEVCKYGLCGFCPHDLFVNTRADLGNCDKSHDEDMVKNYQKSSRFERMGYEEDFMRFLQSLVSDVERRIRRGQARLALNSNQSGMAGAPQAAREDKIQMLTEKINELVEQAEVLGCEGKVEEAQGVMKLCDQLRDERLQLQMMGQKQESSSSKDMEVCSICGALLVVGDAQQRVDEHIMGKQHMGYARIRSYIESRKKKMRGEDPEREALLKEREEREKEREKEREERRKKQEEKEKERELEKEKEREREKEKKEREKEKERDREKERERERDRDKDKDKERGSRRRRSHSRSRSRRRSRSRSRHRRSRSRDRRRRSRSRDHHRRRSRTRSRSRRSSRDHRRSRSRSRSKHSSHDKDRKSSRDKEERRSKEDHKEQSKPEEHEPRSDRSDPEHEKEREPHSDRSDPEPEKEIHSDKEITENGDCEAAAAASKGEDMDVTS